MARDYSGIDFSAPAAGNVVENAAINHITNTPQGQTAAAAFSAGPDTYSAWKAQAEPQHVADFEASLGAVPDSFAKNHPLLNGIAGFGDILIKGGNALGSVLTTPLADVRATVRGVGNLGAYGLAKVAGNDAAANRIMTSEANAQIADRGASASAQNATPQELALPIGKNFNSPDPNMTSAIGSGLKLGAAILAAPYSAWLSSLPGATSVGVGALTGGGTGLVSGIGSGLQNAGNKKLGVLDTANSASMSGVGGAVLGAGLGAAFGKIFGPADQQAAEEKAKALVGKVTQETGRNLDKSARAVADFDKEDIKAIGGNYRNLTATSDARISALKSAVDSEMAKAPDPMPLSSFDKTYEAGSGKVVDNPVIRAMNQLGELYTKTNDPESLAAVMALKEKAQNEGITAQEVNDLARKYGSEFQAFNPNTGNPPTSVTKVGYENTRSALKATARELLPTDTAKKLDAKMSDLIALRDASADMEDRVQQLQNKVDQRNIVEKVARGLGKAFDMATFGGPKAFITKLFFPSNVGLKTLNAIDLQDQLGANLAKANALLQMPEDEAVRQLTEMARAAYPALTAGIGAVTKRTK